MPILVFLVCSRLRPDVRDRQTSHRRQTRSSLDASALWGRGITIFVMIHSLSCSHMHAVCSDAKDARVGVHQPLFMFVFRVLLARAYICRQPKQFKRPPCTDASCCSDTCSKHSLYDSVIGTHNFTTSTPTSHLFGLRTQVCMPPPRNRFAVR